MMKALVEEFPPEWELPFALRPPARRSFRWYSTTGDEGCEKYGCCFAAADNRR
jgi:hypothetical protein